MASKDPLWKKLVQASRNAGMLKTVNAQISDEFKRFEVCVLVRFYIDLPTDRSQLAMLNTINDDTRDARMVCL